MQLALGDTALSITPAWRAGCPPALLGPIQSLVARSNPPHRDYLLRRIGSPLHSSGSLWSLEPRGPSAAQGSRLVIKHGLYVRQEYESLRRIWAAVGDLSHSETVPRPVGIDLENRLVAMSHLDVGATLWSQLFGVGRLLGSDELGAPRAFRQAGRWLASFQRASCSGTGRPPEIRDALERLDQWPRYLSGVRGRLQSRLRCAADKGVTGPLVLSHGDFAPRNVHSMGDGVGVLDWEMMPAGRRSPGYDLHHFLVLLGRHPLWLTMTAAPARELAELFARGYRESAPPPEPVVNRRAVRLAAQVIVLDRQLKASLRQPVRSILTGRVSFVRRIAQQLEQSP